MTIISGIPYTIANGQPRDATPLMADLNSMASDVNANGAHNGANSDITSLIGLTTPLSVAQGGTGTTTGPTIVANSGIAIPINMTIAAAVAANALTISIKTLAGANPSAADPVLIPFRSQTDASGAIVYEQIVGINTITVPDTALLGTSNGVPFRLWVVRAIHNGTGQVGVINCLSGTNIFKLTGWQGGVSTGTMNATADSAHVMYVGFGGSNYQYAVLGYMTWESGLATAGTWSAAPTRIQTFFPGMALPGDIVQTIFNESGAVATGTTQIPNDDTIPQSGEGDEYFSSAIVPSSAANVLRNEAEAMLANSAAAGALTMALFGDTNALAASSIAIAGAGQQRLSLKHCMLAGQNTSRTMAIRAGCSSAGTTTLNGSASARKFGGVANSFLNIEEVMA